MADAIKDIIRKARTEKKISMEELAELTGINKNTIYYIESGKSVPNYDTFIRICKALDINTTKLDF